MHWDFWNNPLIVTSLRIRYRRGGLMNLMMAYFLVLVAGTRFALLYRARFAGPFPRNLLLGVLAVQFLISFIMSTSITSQSLRNEVANRTLDFQRIATLSPFQILLGKLLGEPVLAFFSIIATIPVTVYACLILGVEGMTSFGSYLWCMRPWSPPPFCRAPWGFCSRLKRTPVERPNRQISALFCSAHFSVQCQA